MFSVLLIGLGGFLGAIFRYGVSVWFKRISSYPWGTLCVNLSGSFFLGGILSLPPSVITKYLMGIGFLGAFTTFSTFKWETLQMIRNNSWKISAIYLGVSYMGGVFLAWVGWVIFEKTIAK
ncbi:fluoride efflux transporter FluC [Thermoflavimicrobium dichotomicum]|nr:CrcB family protein [Thermoflavimicrobium dichotomicum]